MTPTPTLGREPRSRSRHARQRSRRRRPGDVGHSRRRDQCDVPGRQSVRARRPSGSRVPHRARDRSGHGASIGGRDCRGARRARHLAARRDHPAHHDALVHVPCRGLQRRARDRDGCRQAAGLSGSGTGQTPRRSHHRRAAGRGQPRRSRGRGSLRAPLRHESPLRPARERHRCQPRAHRSGCHRRLPRPIRPSRGAHPRGRGGRRRAGRHRSNGRRARWLDRCGGRLGHRSAPARSAGPADARDFHAGEVADGYHVRIHHDQPVRSAVLRGTG